MSIGDLALESTPSVRLTWTIPNYFRHVRRSKYSLRSPDFSFADGRYGLRLFEPQYTREPHIELLSLTDPDPGRAVLYEVQVKSKTGEEDIHRTILGGLRFFFDQSDLEGRRHLCVPRGTLTILCYVRQRVGGNPNSGGDRTPVIPPHRMTIGELSFQSTPSLYVAWTIPGFFRLARKSEHTLQSPEFDFSGRRHCLRLVQSGFWVEIRLVNLRDSDPGRYVAYEVGLKITSGEEIHLDRSSTFSPEHFRTDKYDLDRLESKCFPDLTVFCFVGSREPSSEGSPMSGGAETPRSKDPVPQAAGQTKSVGVQTSNEEGDEKGLPETTNSVSCAIQTEIPESVSCANQTEVPESVSCAIQIEVPESVSCAIQTEVVDGQKHSQEEKVDPKGVAKSQYDYKYFLQAA